MPFAKLRMPKTPKRLGVLAVHCQVIVSLTDLVWHSYLRSDALGLMLAKAGVRAHSKVLVLEDGIGLVTAAAAERLGGRHLHRSTLSRALALAHGAFAGFGKVFHVYCTQQPKLELLKRVSSLVPEGGPVDKSVVCFPSTAVASIKAAMNDV